MSSVKIRRVEEIEKGGYLKRNDESTNGSSKESHSRHQSQSRSNTLVRTGVGGGSRSSSDAREGSLGFESDGGLKKGRKRERA